MPTLAELLGTAALLTIVVGSGVMGESLAGGNVAIALLANTLATGAGLVVLITVLGPVSGAHLNPAVTLIQAARGVISGATAARYVGAQLAGAVLGVMLAHAMFDAPLWQLSSHARTGPGQWLSEGVATFGLLLTILGSPPARTPALVGLYITSAYWFTASTSFANPAVTVARALTDTFAGIRPADTPAFILAQLLGAGAAAWLWPWVSGIRRG